MPAFRYLLLSGVIAIFVGAATTAVYDLFFAANCRCSLVRAMADAAEPQTFRWRTGLALTLIAWAPLVVVLVVSR